MQITNPCFFTAMGGLEGVKWMVRYIFAGKRMPEKEADCEQYGEEKSS
jgi:hypothetical protein